MTAAESPTRPRWVRSLDELQSLTPEPGDAAFRDENLRAIYFVVGTIPQTDDLEVVSVAQIREREIVTPDGYDDVLEAIADGRLLSRRVAAERLTPWPKAGEIPDEVVR